MIPLLLGALAIGGILVVAFWDEIVDWLKKLVADLRRMFLELKKKSRTPPELLFSVLKRNSPPFATNFIIKSKANGSRRLPRAKSKKAKFPLAFATKSVTMKLKLPTK